MNKRPPRNGEKVVQKINTLLVDGNALFKTGFFGAKDEYNQNGDHIGGLYQFLTVLRKLLVEDLYHRVYVFWDGDFSGKLRYEIYPPYKSGRGKDYINGTKPTDVSELQQRKMIQDYLDNLFIKQLEHDIIEGDDFIAYYCLTKQDNEKITICSNDRDMCQLISEDVKIYFCDLKAYVDSSNYSVHFPHHKENAVLLKTVLGDDSDSIKGIKGVGEKTLLTQFPELKERKVELSELIERAKKIQEERQSQKKPPLAALTNMINVVTEGVQGTNLYEINARLVNLKEPFMTEDGINELEKLITSTFTTSDRGIKNVLTNFKRDGLDKTIGEIRYPEYLLPFKKLIERI